MTVRTLEARAYITAVDRASAVMTGIGANMGRLATQAEAASRHLQRAGRRMTVGITLPSAMLARSAHRTIYEYEKIGNALEAVTGMTAAQREEVERYAKDLNKYFPATASEIMGAAFELGRAGFNFEQVMGTLRDTLNLGLAGDLELAQAADIATNVMTAMGYAMDTREDAARSLATVVDRLAYVATKSNTDVGLMGDTMKYVAPLARAAGVSIDELSAISMVMAKNGIKGAEAGVAMRSALVRLVKPVKPMQRALAALNLDLNDFVSSARKVTAADLTRSLSIDGIDTTALESDMQRALDDERLQRSPAKLIQKLTEIVADGLGSDSFMDHEKLADSISQSMTLAASKIDLVGFIEALRARGASIGHIANVFDQRQGARLITALFGSLPEVIREVEKEAAGEANRMAEKRIQGYVGQVLELDAAWEGLLISMAESGVLESVTKLLNAISVTLNWIAELNPKALEYTVYAAAAVTALGPVLLILGKIGRMVVLASKGVRYLSGKGAAGLAAIAGGAAGGAGAGAAAARAAGAGATVVAGASKAARLARWSGWASAGLLAYDTYDYLFNFLPGTAESKAATNARSDRLTRMALENHVVAGSGHLPASAWSGKDSTLGHFGGFRMPERTSNARAGFAPMNELTRRRSDGEMARLPSALETGFAGLAAEIRALANPGPIEAELKGKGVVDVRVRVEGPGRVAGMSAQGEGHIAPNVGVSMGDAR